jgi:hypothetical protein
LLGDIPVGNLITTKTIKTPLIPPKIFFLLLILVFLSLFYKYIIIYRSTCVSSILFCSIFFENKRTEKVMDPNLVRSFSLFSRKIHIHWKIFWNIFAHWSEPIRCETFNIHFHFYQYGFFPLSLFLPHPVVSYINRKIVCLRVQDVNILCKKANQFCV